ncbi:T9SS type A sorting domain-containing protein [Ferruginibacter lapsinanis]|uniref:reprolysin-like metallopeptidase n=1 Tax=Ferruginibacter lapsinanis TaxID=563172 RepID=UPI001E558993|nr:zinc-dependent metalloprotease family protein [Ferruginibacter lapsinanis]UEG50174.1 T9SS type A sorting domain-containing protein [Ferruginibacter lapsinanis]
MRKLLLLAFSLMMILTVSAQERNFWKQVKESSIKKDLFAKRYKPSAYKIFQLNENFFKVDIESAPLLKHISADKSDFILSVPNADGKIERYKLVEAPVMDPALAEKYPNIKSYAGQGIDDPTSTIRCDYSPRGFHAMILSSDRKTIYIDPVDRDSRSYVVFSRQDMVNYKQSFHCLTPETADASLVNVAPAPTTLYRGADDGKLRTYRLALACTGEYAQYFLDGTETSDAQRKSKVLAAMVTLLTRTNGIYERDFGIHMNLIANNDAIIYLNPSTDPWSTEWNTKTQQTIDAVIGSANYDIGHLVHKESSAANNNGNAGCIACVCKAGSKGSAFTSHVNPEGDPFVVDYTTHEMGHQFGANHTFTFSNETGTASQMEPGSGSTIMGYAGITGTTDVQAHSDDYFHARSVEQITDYIKLATGGGSCAVVTSTGNAIPTVNAGADYTIPKSTPFALTGVATDATIGDVLTYTWEQYNTGTKTTTMPSATATSGPVFRSRTYTTSPTRTFPILASILDGTNGNTWEKLPSVARTLAFRLTVRDNNAGGGANNSDDVNVTISSTTGPFAVTAPNTAVTWAGGSSQTITWSVNGTAGTPINCANVKISLSTDGGQTFPTVLAASTPNDGSEVLTIPATPTTTARIKIEAVGNIFFDISNTNFTIGGTVACGNPTGLASSVIGNNTATVSWTAVSGAISYAVDYKLTSSSTWVSAATATTATSVVLSGLTQASTYDWRVKATCTSGSGTAVQAQFTTTAPAVCNAPSGLTSSAITTNSATINWTAVSGALSYVVDYKLTSSSTWINAATATTSTSVALSGLTASSTYDWRVTTNCTSGTSVATASQFTTAAVTTTCTTAYEANETLATAAAIATGTPISAAIGSSTDIDYYKIVTTTTGNITVALSNLPGDYDLYVYNAAGTQLGASENASTTNESIALTSQAAGTYYIKVIGYSGAFSTTVCYALNATTSVSTSCVSTYDNATNGTVSGAAQIPLNTNVTGLINTSTDVDYYKFVITTGGTITITLGTLPGDYDVKLYSSNGTTQVGISQNSGTTAETINYTAAAGTYYVRVYGYNSAYSASVCYTLKVATGTASKVVSDFVTVNKNKQLVEIYPNPARNTVNVNLTGYEGASEIRLFDINGRQVLTKKTALINSQIDISTLPKGVYLVKIMNGKTTISSTKIVKQ